MTHTLYGAPISYYTGKVRAYLRWAGLPFEEVAADAEVYRRIILPAVGVAVIPVLRTPDGRLLQDSTEIIEALEADRGAAASPPAALPASPLRRLAALLLELYGDEWLVIPAMHYRWHHNRDWAIRAFGALSAPQASAEEQLAIGARRAAPFAQAAEWLGATPGLHAAVEASYQALLAELDAHFALHPALLGPQATTADFGLIGPLYAHLYRDPASGALMHRLAPQVVRWVEQVHDHPEGLRQPLPPGDELPPTLLPVLRRMAREQLPVLVDTARRTRDWMDQHPGRSLPRALGLHTFTLEGQTGERLVRPYSLWMLQRVSDHLDALTGDDQGRAQALLREIGAEALITGMQAPRLARDGLSVRPALTPAQAARAAADLLWQHRQAGTTLDALPPALRPQDAAQGHAIQAQWPSVGHRPVVGWKIAATSAAGQAHIHVSGPLPGRILDGWVHPAGATVSLRGNRMRVIEPEFAFCMATDLPPRDAPRSQAEVLAAVASLHPAFEVPDSRYSDFTLAGEAQILADDSCCGPFIFGPAAPDEWRALDLGQHAVQVAVSTADGALRANRIGHGSAALGDPRAALTWLVNQLSSLGIALQRGQMVSTGTCMVPLPIAPGDRVVADFGVLGCIEVALGD